MEESTSREKILKKIRDALIEKSEVPYPIIDQDSSVYPAMPEPLDITFAEELVRVGGKFVYCESEDEFTGVLKSFIVEKNWSVLFCQDPALQRLLKDAGIPFEPHTDAILETRISLTRCEYLIARQGAVMVSSRLNPGRKIYSFPDVHLVMAYSSQLVPELKHALAGLKKKYRDNFPSMVSLVTGPSRTADIEKTLVMGAHGPVELYVFLIDDSTTPVQP